MTALFTKEDFDVFTIDGLDERMEVLRSRLSPKLEMLATELAPYAEHVTDNDMYVHVAKHARRTKNAPNDTWSALASSKRGYKKLPHFQIGLWGTHVFVQFALIYESPLKETVGHKMTEAKKQILESIPSHYVWSMDHMKPDASPISDELYDKIADRLQHVKKAELVCGVHLQPDDPALASKEAFLKVCQDVLKHTAILYEQAAYEPV
ncbi:YktB family protein [Terribacillus saccharophilus]|uniref:YktB family protein n=1 Tax=Terribacillus saccharophilus TaxID=361277 RepID=UPI003981C630